MSLTTNEKNHTVVSVIQGEYAVSASADEMLSTVLGSCVATCLYDEAANVGGMNHFLLPGSQDHGSSSMSYGLNAMELLINDLLKLGARRNHFKAKLFGGARMMKGLSDIGSQNAEFAQEFLQREGIPCVGVSLGGERARRVHFWPSSGKARQLLLGKPESVEPKITKPAPPKPVVDDIELF